MPATPGTKNLLLGLALFTATFLAYIPAIRSGFVWDDNVILWDSAAIASPKGLLWFWFSTNVPDYFPLSSSMLWFEWRIFGPENPWGYHAINIALHAGSALILWRLLLRLGVPAALFAAFLFALHPVNVEAVAWIAQRKSTLSLLFALLATHLYFKGEKPAYRMALLCFLLALLAKTSVAMLPVALLILQYWRSGSLGRSEIVRTLPFFALAGVLSIVTIWFQYNLSIGEQVVREDGLLSRLALSGWAIWFYLFKAIAPLNLSFMYPRWEADIANPFTWLPLLLIILSLFALWRMRAMPWARALFATLAIYIAMLFPVLGFFNIYFMRYSLVADHWQYPAIPALLAIVAAFFGILAKRLPNRAVTRGLTALLLVSFAALTWRLAGNYKDEETLWRATIETNPSAWSAHEELSIILTQQGRHQEAIQSARLALQIPPERGSAHNNLAFALSKANQLDEAVYHALRAAELDPKLPVVWFNAGQLLSHVGRRDEAVAYYRKCLDLNPAHANAHADLGLILLEQGKLSEARFHLENASFSFPYHATTLGKLAWILATAPDETLRDGARAVELATRADDRSGNNPEILRSLAAAFAETGRFEEAIATAQRGILLAANGNIPALAARIRTDLESYKKGFPLRDLQR